MKGNFTKSSSLCRFLLIGLYVLTLVGTSFGQVLLTNTSPSNTIDFSNSMQVTVGTNPSTAFAGSGFSPAPVTAGRLNSNAWAVTGWSDGALAFGGTNTAGDYARGIAAAAITTGGMYAFTGAPQSSTNPCLMLQPGGSDWAPGTLTLKIQNNGNTNIKKLVISYNIYVRNDQGRGNSFNFSHSADNVTYTTVPALDYTSTQVADGLGWVLVGVAPSRSTTITGLNIAPGAFYYIRWSGADVNGSGSRDEFGLDDISIAATFECDLTDGGLSNIHCEDNEETNDDPSDDYIWFDLNPVGFSLGTGYSVTVNTGNVMLNGNAPATNVAYGSNNSFRLQQGSAGGGNVVATITDVPTGNACTIDVTIIDPGSCSTASNCSEFTGLADIECNDNETGSDPSDDFIVFTLNPSGSFATTYDVIALSFPGQVTLLDGSPATGVPYGVPTQFRLQDGSAGGGSFFIVVVDGNNQFCGLIEEITDPGSCSTSGCNLTITSINATPETCPDENDGAITVVATCTNCDGPLEYSIDGVNYQPGNIFTGLPAGSYSVFVRESGNPDCSEGGEATVEPGDDAPPYFDQNPLPQDETYECTQQIPDPVDLTASDLVDQEVDVTFDQQITPGNCPQEYAITRTWTATDDCGNSTQHTQTIMVVDNTPPSLLGVPDLPLSVECDQPVPDPAEVDASDLCDEEVTVEYSESDPIPGNCPQEYSFIRTWTATDDCGNVASATQVVMVTDNTPPVFNQNPLPQNYTAYCGDPLPMPEMLDGTDNCDPGQSPPVIFINEIHYDNVGTDAGEFIEVAGTAGIDLSNYQIVLYNGAAGQGTQYGTTILSGIIPDQGNGFGAVAFNYPANGIQNGSPDGFAFATTSGLVLQFLSYEGTFTAVGGVADGMTSTDIGIQEDGTNAVGTSLQLTGSGQEYGDFTWTGPVTASPGALNAGQTLTPLPAVIMAVFSQEEFPGECNGESIISRMWMLTDACGNATTHTQDITLIDDTGPAFVPPLPPNITINCNDPVPPPANLLASDACDMGNQTTRVWINEIHYDNVGNDAGEFVEIAGTAGTDMSEYQIVLYNGTGGAVYDTDPLTGIMPNLSNGFGTVCLNYPVNGIQNGAPDGIALVHNVMGGMVVQFLSYEGTFMAVGGPANGMTSTDIGVSENGTNAAGTSVRLTGTGNQYSDFTWNAPATASNCAINAGQTFVALPQGPVVTMTETSTPGTCPQERTITRTWTASDNCGNSSQYTQTISVVDDTPPAFNPPLPPNLNLNCQDVVPPAPTLTATDLCDPVTPVTFNQSITPGDCPQERTITRTWSTTDDCGNTNAYTQTIVVSDNSGPIMNCPPGVTITLDIFGNATVSQSSLGITASDNCSPSGQITIVAPTVSFDCDDDGTTVNYTATATDACGNVSTCTIPITILPFPRCTPVILITDPCVCKNNATNLYNGQFGETIKIESLAGKTWTVIANTGFYRANSPAPPAAPILVPLGTTFTESPVPSGDYYLNGLHVDELGYSITVRSNTGEILTIGNSCLYPNPEITADLGGPFCLYSNPVDLTGTPGDAHIVSQGFTVNGVPATQFDPGQGVGAYVIEYTVDGGVPKAFGADDPGCVIRLTQTVHVIATPAVLNCNDLVYVSLPASCEAEIKPDDILEGTYGCYDDYYVELDRTLPMGNGPWTSPVVGPADIGKTYQVRVTHHISGNKCWGNVKIEDKIPPILSCENFSVPCNVASVDPAYLLNHLGITAAFPNVSDCQTFNLTFIDAEQAQNCASGYTKIVTRKWTATDASGNSSTCLQQIYFIRPTLDQVSNPPDYDDIDAPAFHCTDHAYPSPDWIEAQGLQGYPWVFGAPSGCNINWGYEDLVIDVCDGTYKIRREWTVIDWCIGDGYTYNQIIKVIDDQGPVMACPPALTVSTDPFQCCAIVDMPDVVIEDNCSRINNISGMVVSFDPFTGEQTGMHTFGGQLKDFPGNNWWDLDTLGAFGSTSCLSQGFHIVTYIAEDDCGNTATCEFELTVADLIPPLASCDQTTTVAIGVDDPYDCYEPFVDCEGAGVTVVPAQNFDDGSHDQCNNIKLTIRRMEPYSDCIEFLDYCEYEVATAESDSIKFYCCEVGSTQTVILRAYQLDVNGDYALGLDGEPIYNECMIQVEVQDKLKPVCVPPPNVTVTCEQFDPSLWLYGKATVHDNCCLDESKEYQGQCGLQHTVSYTNFDTLCNKGTIVRTFRAFDCHGQSSQCTQRIVVTYEQDYYVKFPNDVIVTTCDGTGSYGEPTFYGEDCELLGVSHEDEIFTVVPDACYKIERNWKIINWCTYNPNLTPLCIAVPNPNPNAITNHTSNLAGPIVSPIQTPNDPWKSTIVKINPTDALATNYSVYYDPNANCYTYKQIIKIIDTQDPVVECPASPVTVCDYSTNDPLLWNEMYWWDNGNQSHDLCEAPTEICITATDACSGANINIEYQLFLDLDGDGTMETVVNSTQLGSQPGGLGWNNIWYNNLNGAGVSRQFDGRPVAGNQKWGFAIQESVSGNKKTACVKFNTQQSQNSFVPAQLPLGIHKIKWFVSDGCGNETVCEYTVIVKDCKAPTVVCRNGLSVNIMPGGMITLWATDFLQYAEDNCTLNPYLKYSIRKCDPNASGFPVDGNGNPITNVTFDCTELGTQCVELWSIDLAGNADRCETYVIVQDNNHNCGNMLSVAGNIKTQYNGGIQEANVEISGSVNFAPPFYQFDLSDIDGHYEKLNVIPVNASYDIKPVKDDNPLNGVTTYDLVLISQHILGIEPLDGPYNMIAADANKSGSITTFDIVEIRKVILGIYNEFPDNNSWRFIDKSFQFPNQQNPFETPFPETISIANVLSDQMQEHFVGVKIGDVNNTVVTNINAVPDDRTAGTLNFDVEDRMVQSGETFTVRFKAAEKTQGYQLTLRLNGLELVDFLEGNQVNASNFGVFKDAVTVSINGSDEFTLKFKAAAAGKISSMLGVSSSITRAEAYPNVVARERKDVALKFNSPEGSTISGVGFELYQNEPNPFVNKTCIGFHLPEAATATLSIYDETGRQVYVQKGEFAKGYNTIVLDAALVQGKGSGALYYTLETATDMASKKMIQMR